MKEEEFEMQGKRRDQYEKAAKGCVWSIGMLFIASLLMLLLTIITGCSPKIIEHEIVKHDTTYVEKLCRDSIYMHDSIYVHEYTQGDTVYRERDRWHYAWRDRLVHDSIYIAQRDTITNTEIREVERELSGWQWFQIWAGRIALILAAGCFAYITIKSKT